MSFGADAAMARTQAPLLPEDATPALSLTSSRNATPALSKSARPDVRALHALADQKCASRHFHFSSCAFAR
eukprot:15477406-Alexandrium_andersonii.AAC.1